VILIELKASPVKTTTNDRAAHIPIDLENIVVDVFVHWIGRRWSNNEGSGDGEWGAWSMHHALKIFKISGKSWI
jgi:hypothetical protein